MVILKRKKAAQSGEAAAEAGTGRNVKLLRHS